MGYDGPGGLGGLRRVGVGDSEMECERKEIEKQYRVFETFLPIVPVKLNFWALSYFESLKDNVKQATQLNIIIFDNNNNDSNNNNNDNNNNLERLEDWERFLKSKATGCGSISTVFSSIVLMFVSSITIITIAIITIIIIDHNSN